MSVDPEKGEVPAATGGGGAPPPFEMETNQASPPSYSSLFGELQNVKKENPAPASFMKAFYSVVANTIGMTIMLGILNGIQIAMIVIGSLYLYDCPAQRLIPIYLIVEGSFFIVKSIFDLKARIQRQKLPAEEQQEYKPPLWERIITRTVGTFLFAFFICGNVWTYSIYRPNSLDPSAADYCHRTLYDFAFWNITGTYIIIAVFQCCCLTACFIACCACCGAAAAGKKKEEEAQ
ncbi:transmembrane protein 272-like [Diadema setosum]|uniref:transmembrane protein 272-like n=1 Tax=Diadema setosum TaxID=31175 RepID=UPI003B3A56C5